MPLSQSQRHDAPPPRAACGVPILSQPHHLGIVRSVAVDLKTDRAWAIKESLRPGWNYP